ncbi:hypothetical protein ABPG75_001774 [Micractinium tetrahymenae]
MMSAVPFPRCAARHQPRCGNLADQRSCAVSSRSVFLPEPSNMAAALFQLLQLPQAARQARGLAVKASALVGKKELAASVISKHPKLFSNKEEAEDAVKAVLDSIVDSVAAGKKVQVVGFGTFESRTRAARKGRNPATGVEIDIPETTVPAFSAGKTFKQKVKEAKH